MSQILVWKSDFDGKLFEDKSKYQKHLRALAADRRQKKKLEDQAKSRELFLVKMGQVASIDELNQFIKDNWYWFFLNAVSRNSWRSEKSHGLHEYVDVAVSQVRWNEYMSNSHSRPRKGVENFMRQKDKPQAYPGWRGRINIKVKPPMSKHKKNPYMKDGFGSDYFADTLINTGSGGGGENFKSYSYDVSLWALDFPVMYEAHRRQEFINNENARRQREWSYLGGKGPVPLISDVPNDWVCPEPGVYY